MPGTDPNVLLPQTANDATNVEVGNTVTIDVLANDDFLDNDDPANLEVTSFWI